MKTIVLAAALAALPAAVLAQGYSYDAPMSREQLRSCMERDGALRDRLADLDHERLDNDRETEAIAREAHRLAQELGRIDPANAGAVAGYNAHSDAHNRRVAVHNRRVADMNARASLHNGDAADVSSRCASRTYDLRDRDEILRDRIR